MTGLQLGVSVLGNAVSCALSLLYKHAVSLHPLLGAASLNPTKTPQRGLVWGRYRAWAEQNHTYDRNPVSAGHSDRQFDLKIFL